MKNTPVFPSAVILTIAALSISALTTSCKKENFQNDSAAAVRNTEPQKATGAPVKADFGIGTLHIEDANGQPPTGDGTPLYDNRGHVPLFAPDGHQVTLGEYNQISGWSDVKCLNSGTHVVVHLKGLIPNGQYTLWLLTFKSPGFDGTFANLIGFGAAGNPDGSENPFKASSAGTASLSVKVPGGPLSIFGSVENCLGSEFEMHFVAAYHLDNQVHGPVPGTPDTWIAQGAFRYRGAQLN